MPARIVLVHTDDAFRRTLVSMLDAAGYEIIAFDNANVAFEALNHASQVELLITRLRFPPGQANGLALVHNATMHRKDLKVILVAAPEMVEHAEGNGLVFTTPVEPAVIVEAVQGLLGPTAHSSPDTSPPDTSTPDTSLPDTSLPDTSPPDTSPPDTSLPDTSPPDTSLPARLPAGSGDG